jgi:hypothetical protein
MTKKDKKDKKETITEDYEWILNDVLNGKGNIKSGQNMKDVIKILLRLVSDPTRSRLKKEAKEKGIKTPVIHHCSKKAKKAKLKKGKYISDLADRLIDGKISPQKAIKECLNSMRAISKKEHDKIHS